MWVKGAQEGSDGGVGGAQRVPVSKFRRDKWVNNAAKLRQAGYLQWQGMPDGRALKTQVYR